MEKRMNKKAQGLSTNAIILIVLGVVVLVVLVMGFWLGWEKIAPWLSSENVGTVVSSCEVVCMQGGQYAFCSQERELIDAENNKIKTSCEVLSKADDFDKYGIKECPSLDCGDLKCIELKVNGNNGTITSSTEESYKVSKAVIESECFVLKKAAK